MKLPLRKAQGRLFITWLFSITIQKYEGRRIVHSNFLHINKGGKKTNSFFFKAIRAVGSNWTKFSRKEPRHISYCKISLDYLFFHRRTATQIKLKISGNLLYLTVKTPPNLLKNLYSHSPVIK